MKLKIRIALFLLSFLFAFNSFSQKWYYHSMKGSIQKCDTTTNLSEIEKCKQVFDRVLISRPNDSLALYYSLFANCLKYYYTKTLIYANEQVALEKQLSKMDTVFVNKNEINILKLFYKLLCNDIKVDEKLLSQIDTLTKQNEDNIRMVFVEKFAFVKADKIKRDVLFNLSELTYSKTEELKVEWGRKQILYLDKYIKE